MLDMEDSFSDRQLAFPTGTNMTDLFLYSFRFLDKLVKDSKRKLARKFNILYCYTNALSLLMMKDLRSALLIFSPRNSTFPRPQSLSFCCFLFPLAFY